MEHFRYTSGYKHQLFDPYEHQTSIKLEADVRVPFLVMTKNGLLQFASGYAWDGPSGEIRIPPFLPDWMPAVRVDVTKDDEKSMRGSLVHDGLYQLMRWKLVPLKHRSYADQLLKDICIEAGMSTFMATQWRNAVNKFAKGSALPKNKKKVKSAW